MKNTPITRRLAIAAVASLAFLAACGGSNAGSDTTAPADTLRIVSLSPTATEMLYAIGAGDQVVAVDSLSTHPEEVAPKVTKISAYEPSAEAILEYEPDVVLISNDMGGIKAQLEGVSSRKITVWTGPAAASLDDVYGQIVALGDLTGKRAEADALVASMKGRITAAVDYVASQSSSTTDSRYFYELDDTYYTVTSNTFVGSLMKQFGLENIADGVEEGNDYPQLSAESIIKAAPRFVFLADTKCCGQNAETVAKRPGWDAIPAVADGSILELDDDIASRWGPRVADLVEQVAKFLAPSFTPEG